MRLPRLLLLTDRTQCDRPLPDVVAAAVEAGVRAVVLREKDLPDQARAGLAAQLRPLLDEVDGLLVMAGGPGDAVHLAAAQPTPTPRPWLVGRSCHNRGEVDAAAAEACDYVTVSPVFATASKPGYGPPLGIAGLAALTAGAPPVYALAGVRADDVPACLGAGAYGVAVMGPLMRRPEAAADYAAAVTEVPA